MWANQTIKQPWGISVFGSALVQTEPDLALLRFTIGMLADKPAAAFASARESAVRVRAALASAGIPDTAVQTSRMGLKQKFEFSGGGQKFVGYRAEISFRARITNLESVEKLLADLVAAGAAQIDSVEFQTSQLRAIRAQARQLAVEAARKKAENYAEAAGVALGTVIHIEDLNPDDLLAGGRGGHEPNAQSPQADEEQAGGSTHGSVTVSAAVLVGYSIRHD